MAKIKFEIPQFAGTNTRLNELLNEARQLRLNRMGAETGVYLQPHKETMKKIQPNKVKTILCPKCKELMVKIYPWSSILIPPGMDAPLCRKCQAEKLKS